MTPKYSPILCDPQNYPQNLHTQKNIIFVKTLKNIEIQNFDPPPKKKRSLSLRMYENIKVPPTPPPGVWVSNLT